jgi:hypothetical protein
MTATVIASVLALILIAAIFVTARWLDRRDKAFLDAERESKPDQYLWIASQPPRVLPTKGEKTCQTGQQRK